MIALSYPYEIRFLIERKEKKGRGKDSSISPLRR
jgi:hypothetical protein